MSAMAEWAESEVSAVLGELRVTYPDVKIWIETIRHVGPHWMASGNPRPWLVMTHDLGRFRAELARIRPASAPDEQGLCAYEHPGPCQWLGEGTARPPGRSLR